jgi:hypothetical protein
LTNALGPTKSPIYRFSRKACKSRIDVAASAREEDFDRLIDGRSRSSDVRNEGLGEGPVRIDDHGKAVGSRLQIVQEAKLLCPKLIRQKADAGDVAARPIEAGDEALLDRIYPHEDDWLVVFAALAAGAEAASVAAIKVT